VVEQDFAIIATVREMEPEDELASKCDMAAELLPPL
jgi:hypothetical protein